MNENIKLADKYISELEEQMGYAMKLMQHFKNSENFVGYAKAKAAYNEVHKDYEAACDISFQLRSAAKIIADCWAEHKGMMNKMGIDL